MHGSGWRVGYVRRPHRGSNLIAAGFGEGLSRGLSLPRTLVVDCLTRSSDLIIDYHGTSALQVTAGKLLAMALCRDQKVVACALQSVLRTRLLKLELS